MRIGLRLLVWLWQKINRQLVSLHLTVLAIGPRMRMFSNPVENRMGHVLLHHLKAHHLKSKTQGTNNSPRLELPNRVAIQCWFCRYVLTKLMGSWNIHERKLIVTIKF